MNDCVYDIFPKKERSHKWKFFTATYMEKGGSMFRKLTHKVRLEHGSIRWSLNFLIFLGVFFCVSYFLVFGSLSIFRLIFSHFTSFPFSVHWTYKAKQRMLLWFATVQAIPLKDLPGCSKFPSQNTSFNTGSFAYTIEAWAIFLSDISWNMCAPSA